MGFRAPTAANGVRSRAIAFKVPMRELASNHYPNRELEKARQAAGVSAAAAIGGALLGAYFGIDSGIGRSVLGGVGELAFMRPNSREMEQEADRVGVELAARAAYDPQAAITLWEKMERAGGAQAPQWLSTHPSHASRLADLRVYAARVQPLYAAARKSR